MKYLHTMIRITDVDESLDFFCNKLGMLDYAGANISVIRSIEKKPGYVSVYTNIQPVGFPAENATFDARLVSGSWKAYNVTLKGIDLITNFRTNFTRDISASGIEALIKRLESTGA